MQIVKLKDLCKGKGEYGIAAAAEDYSSKKTRYLRITDISDFGELLNNDPKSISCSGSEMYMLNEGDIVFARTGNSTGRTFYYEEKYGPLIFAGFLIRFSLDPKKVNPKFLKYYTISRTYKDWISASQGGSTRGNMSEGDFANMPVFLPSRRAQDALVSIMDNLTEKISNNNSIISEFEAMAKDIYDYWFVQFDFPDANGKPYKSSGGKMVWNENLKREIPEGWKVEELLSICSWESASQPPKSEFIYSPKEGYIRFIQNRDFDSDSNITFIPLKPSTKTCNKYDILVDKYGDKTAGMIRYGLEGAYNVALGKLGVKNKKLQEYLRMYLSTPSMFSYLHNACTASTRSSMNETVFVGINVPIPPSGLCSSFDMFHKQILDRIYGIKEEDKQLTALRDWLLPMLMNGQVKVGGVA